MIVLTSSIASVQTGAVSQELTSASLTGLSTGLGISSLGHIVGRGMLANTYGSIGASASAGAIISSCVTGTPLGAVVGSMSGALSSGAFEICAAVAAGPIVMLMLGAEYDENCRCTYDCWKPILHDVSIEKSQGMIFGDVINDERVKHVDVENEELVLKNIWNESFMVRLVEHPAKGFALHATEMK